MVTVLRPPAVPTSIPIIVASILRAGCLGSVGSPADVAPDHDNAMWTTVRADGLGAFHFGVEGLRGRDAIFVHGVLGADGAVATSATVASWAWADWPPTEPGPDAVESLLGAWRGSLYPAFAFQQGGGIMATTAKAESSLQRVGVVPEAG